MTIEDQDARLTPLATPQQAGRAYSAQTLSQLGKISGEQYCPKDGLGNATNHGCSKMFSMASYEEITVLRIKVLNPEALDKFKSRMNESRTNWMFDSVYVEAESVKEEPRRLDFSGMAYVVAACIFTCVLIYFAMR